MSDLYQVECTAVPDGLYNGPSGERFARLSVVLRGVPYTPLSADEPIPDNVVDLLAWPDAIPKLNFLVFVGPNKDSLVPLEGLLPEFDPPLIDSVTREAANRRAAAWWAQIWRKNEVRTALRRIMSPAPTPPAKAEFYSYAGLADLSYARAISDIEISLTAAIAREGKAAPLAQAKGLAGLRRDNPASPVVRLADANALIQRDAFAGLMVNDAIDETLSAAASPNSATAFADDSDACLRDVFVDVRSAIDRAERADKAAAGIGKATRTESWNPLLESPSASEAFLHSDSAEKLFTGRFTNSQFGAALGAPGTKLDKTSISAVALNLAAFARMRASDEDLGAAPADALKSASDEEVAEDVARRNLAALQAHPTLRKFVRMIIDIPIPLAAIHSKFPDMRKGIFAVDLPGNIAATTATAFELDPGADIFEPCPEWKYSESKNPSLVPSLPLDRGVVQLNIGRQGQTDDSRRFRIEVMDASSATLSMQTGVQALVEAWRKGVAAADLKTDEPQLRTRGIMVLDTETIVPAHIRAGQSRSRPLELAESRTLYAEDLVDGYRVDMVAPTKVTVASNLQRQVFPTAERTLRYDVIDEAFNAAGQANPYATFAHRDEGFVANPARTRIEQELPADGSPPIPRTVQMNSEVLFCWTGASLGLPTPWDETSKIPPLPADDIQVKPIYDYPSLPGPILRDGRRYRVMMRARKINGSSITVKAAEALLDHALGDPITHQEFTFIPVERAPAPLVLVERDQKLMGDDPNGDQPLANKLSVRAGQSARRILVSPDIGFEIAERQGQFDGPTGPGSASQRAIDFGSYARLARSTEDGRTYPSFPNTTGIEMGRALLFDILGSSTRPAKPIYVDRTTAFLGTALRATGATPELSISASHVEEELSYWNRTDPDPRRPGQGFSPDAVRPILLEATAGLRKSRVFKSEKKIGPSGNQITVPVLSVEVGPGDTVELEVWANRLGTTIVQQGPMSRLLAGVAKRMGAASFAASPWKTATTSALGGAFAAGASETEKWWTRIARKARVPSLSEAVTFSIAHPVDKPLTIPSFERLGSIRRIDVTSWESVADNPSNKNQAEGEAIFTFGSIRIDRKTTGLVAAECAWIETLPAVCLRRTTAAEDYYDIEPQGLFEYREQPAEGQLFVIDKIPGLSSRPGEADQNYSDRVDILDLVGDEVGAKRNLTAGFRTHRARRLVVRLAARSRFAPAGAPQGAPAYISKSADNERFQRALNGETNIAGVEAFWLPATRKPAPPGLASATGTLYRRRFDPLPGGTGKLKGARLTHLYRCWLDGEWFDSGPYEKLAIICRNDSAALAIGDPNEPAPWVISQLSRWGGDMTMAAAIELGANGTSRTFLRPEEIVAPGKVDTGPGGEQVDAIIRKIALPAPVDGDAAGSTAAQRSVTLVLLTPKFHTGYGRWYCDIELKNIAAFRAILQLSIARYQEHAIDGCKLSEARQVGAFVLHQPWTFLASRVGKDVKIVAAGPSYIERAPMMAGLEGADRIGGGGGLPASRQAERPLITVELERINGGTPLPVMSSTGDAVFTTSRQSIAMEESPSDLPPGWTRWTMTLAIPDEPVEADRYAVRISLSSAHANSQARGQIAPDGALVYLPEPLVVQLLLDPR